MADGEVRAEQLPLEQQVALLSGRDVWHTRDLPEAGVPSVLLTDGPHGLRVQEAAADQLGLGRSHPATCFPTAVTLASSWDEDLLEEVGRAIGIEARVQEVGVVLGPGLNIKRHPLGGRNFEYLSEDPLLSGRLAAAMVRGIQSRGVGACVKHFAVNNQESYRFVTDAVVDERTLRELYLAGFEHVVTEARPWAVMAAYNAVNGSACTHHTWLLRDVLRADWGFAGLVVSDWGATVDRVRGVAAGMDLEMPSSGGVHDTEVLRAVASGALDPALVAASAQRVLDLAGRAASAGGEAGDLPIDVHDALARKAAAAGTVLLANDGVLPLADDTEVALIGAFADHPRFQGAGSSQVHPTRVTTAHDAMRDRGVVVTYARGYDPARPERDAALLGAAVAAARAAEVAVIMVGLPATDESEGFDRDGLRLPDQHDALVRAVCAANPRTVVVLSSGGPVAMPWRHEPAAVLAGHLGGQAGGGALVDVLFGDREPGGRLAETWPLDRSDLAADPWFPGDRHRVEHREGLFVGYRHTTTADVEVAFPFGHGLSYTSFEWGEPAVDRGAIRAGERVVVRVPVTNVGDRPGAEVVQVYRHDRTGVVLRPRRELVGFDRVQLDVGEHGTAEIVVPGRAFAFYDVDEQGWRHPSGPHDLEVARSSTDVVHTLTVEVTDGVTTAPEPPSAPAVAVTDEDFERRLGRPVTPRPALRPFTRESTLGEVSTTLLGRLLRAGVLRAGPVDDAMLDDDATRRMVQRSMDELPLRALVAFGGGRLTPAGLDALVDLLNGRVGEVAGRGMAALRRRLRP